MKTSYVICFVCGSKGANCILYVKPRAKGSYFSFLEYHDPPKGAKLPNGEGIVNACLVCYAFLNQQWDSFEKTKTPLVKRLYWLKRIDNRAFTGAELNVQGEYVAQIMGVQYNCGISGNVSPFEYGSHTGISCNARNFSSSPVNDSNVSPSLDEKPGEILGVLDLSVSPKKPKSTGQKSQKLDDIHGGTKCNAPGGNRSKSGSIVCYICAKPSPMSLARFVFAIDQSDDDEPYFPFLLELAEPPGAMPLTRNGVTQVCSECRKALNRQWRFFDAQKVPVTDRVYKVKDLTISPGKPAKENASAKGACRLCDELHSLTSMHALKVPVSDTGDGASGISELVEKLKFGRCGVQPADSPVLVCSPCLDRICSQRNLSDKSGLALPGPVLNGTSAVFSFTSQNGATLSNGKKPANQKKSSVKNSSAVNGDSGFDWRRGTSKSTFAESSCADNTAASTSCSADGMFKLPFDSPILQIKPDSIRHTVTDANSTQDEASLCAVDAVVREKQTRLDDACKKLQPGDDSVCFLCGFICSRSRKEWRFSSVMICDHVDPNNSDDSNERPFFPFLRKLSPFLGAEELNAEGCTSVCFVCYRNLLTQWNAYEKEKSDDVKPSNRRLRSYDHRSFVCGVCNDSCERRNVEIVASEDFEQLGKLNAFTADGKSRDFVLVCSSCCDREKVGDLFSGKVPPNSSYSTSKRVNNCPQIESHSVVVSKVEDDRCTPPVVVDGEPASNHQKNSSSSSSSLSPPLLSSPKHEKRSNNGSATNGGGGGGGEAGVKQKSRISEHLLAGRGSGCLEALRKMALGAAASPDFAFLNTSTETKKLRNGEEAVGGEKNFHAEGKNPAFITNNQNGFVSMQEHLPCDVDPPLGIKIASGKLEDFATAGKMPSRPISVSSVLANISTSHSQHNGFPYSASSLKTPNEHLLSSLGHPAFVPHLFPLMPDSLYLPEVLSPSSRLTYPLSNSSLSWEDYQTARKFRSALSSSMPYQGLFHPSLAHPMLSFKPGAVSPFFYPGGSLTSASAGAASTFDLAASFLRRRGADSRDAEASDSCASSELDVCNERTESPFKFANGGNDREKDAKIDELNGRAQSSPRFRLGGNDRGLSDSRTVSDRREKDFGFPRKKVPAKHNFHRPFLENDSADRTKSGGTFERQKERGTRDGDAGTIASENSPPRDQRLVEPTSRSVESKPSEEEVDSVYTLGDPGVAQRTVSNSTRSSIGFPSKCPTISDGVRDTGAAEFQFKDERLNAAIGLISLYSAHIQSSPKRTASICDSRNDSSTSDSKSSESSLPNSTMLPSIALETGVGKRLRLDNEYSDNQRNNRITCDYGLICETGSAASPLNSSGAGEDLKNMAFPWPGVDAIIESYQQYRQDYATEKSFLWDQDQRTGETRQLLLSSAEKLSNRITELTQTKKDLENERVQLQTHLDAFISCVRELK